MVSVQRIYGINMKTKSELKQAALAMMWGDGYLEVNKNSGKARLQIYHSLKQEKYLRYKGRILEDITGTKVSYYYKEDKRKLVGGGTREGLVLQTNYTRYFYNLSVSPTVFQLKQLVKPLALSILWQDDGAVSWCKKGYFSTAKLCTDSWDREDLINFQKRWNNMYGWQPALRDQKCRGKSYNRLVFRKKEVEKLSEIIKSYVSSDLEYKLILKITQPELVEDLFRHDEKSL